ncbi:MAG: hypothetical protein Unbinned8596contig1000_48 [Prokaryotic dsDNA virus sp.]|nr:MAG: hypothetical protein Unbinned8596contig1000_48 [Prokaryotic dsDNA virus sp.]|tara:strand:+ start:38300 stop:38647 length:348 start_codon:yes stop_codon:yes gene_type:complete
MKTSRLTPTLPDGVKTPVKVATIENIELKGLQNINGYQLNDNDRVLVKNQDFPFTNGIYNAHATGWTLAKDWKYGSQIVSGVMVLDDFTGELWRGKYVEPVFNVGLTSIEFLQLG